MSYVLGKITRVIPGNIGTDYEYLNLVLDARKENEPKRFGSFLGNPRHVVVHCMTCNGYADVLQEFAEYGESAFLGDVYRIDLESYQDNGRYGIEYYPATGSNAHFECIIDPDPAAFCLNIEGIHQRGKKDSYASDSCINDNPHFEGM